jgi:hypothetical protein
VAVVERGHPAARKNVLLSRRRQTLPADGCRRAACGEQSHTIQLPDSGNANNTPKALGASLVVVYRSPSAAETLKAVVIYDGLYTLTTPPAA